MTGGKPASTSPFPYGGVIASASRIFFQHPILWVFGMFAALGTGGGGIGSSIPDPFTWSMDGVELSPAEETEFDYDAAVVMNWLGDHLVPVVAVALILVALIALAYFVSILFGAAMLRGMRGIERGEKPGWKKNLGEGRSYFGRYALMVVGFDLLTTILIITALMPSVLVLAAGELIPINLDVLAIPFIVASVLAAIFIVLITSLIRTFTARALLVDDKGFLASLEHGARILVSLRMKILWLTLMAILLGSIASIFVVVVMVVLWMPLLVGLLLFFLLSDLGGVAVVFGGIALSGTVLLAVAVTFFALGLPNTFFAAYWTAAYRGLTSNLVSLEESV